MIATRSRLQLGLGFGGSMTMAAGIVKADLPGGKTAVSIELAGEPGVNGDDMSGHISHESLGIG